MLFENRAWKVAGTIARKGSQLVKRRAVARFRPSADRTRHPENLFVYFALNQSRILRPTKVRRGNSVVEISPASHNGFVVAPVTLFVFFFDLLCPRQTVQFHCECPSTCERVQTNRVYNLLLAECFEISQEW